MNNKRDDLLGIICVVLILLSVYATSWVLTCGIVALVCYAFSLRFSFIMATIVWVAFFIIKRLLQILEENNK